MGFVVQTGVVPGARPGRSGQHGTTIVEFTLIFTLFFMIVGFIVQGAFLFNAWLVSTNAVREAARLGAPCFGRQVNSCSATDVVQIAYSAAAGTDPNVFTPSAAACLDTTTTPNVQTLRVTATYKVPILAPFVGRMFSQNPIPIFVESRMRLENPQAGTLPTCPKT